MPYAPETQYRGDVYISRGQENAWSTLGGILQQQLASQKQDADKATALRKVVDVYANELPEDAGDGLRNASKAWGVHDLEGFVQGTAMVGASRAAAAKAHAENVKTALDQAKLDDTTQGRQQLGSFLQAWQQGAGQPTMTPGDRSAPFENPTAGSVWGNPPAPPAPVATGAPDVLGALLRAGQSFPAGMRASGALAPLLRRMAPYGGATDGAQEFNPSGGTVEIPMGDGSSIKVPFLKTSKGNAKSLEEFTPGNPKYPVRAGQSGATQDAVPIHDENGTVIGHGLPNGRGGITQVKTSGKSEDTGPNGEPIYSKDGKMYWDSHYKAWKPRTAGKEDLFSAPAGGAAAPVGDPSDPLGLGLGPRK